MPIVPTSPSTRTHSCSSVYLTLAMNGSLSAVVGVFDERHRHDLGRHRLAAHHQVDLGADRTSGALDIAHGDGAPERWGKAARRDLADDGAGNDDLRAIARNRLSLGQQADALARRTRGDLLLDDLCAGKAASDATLLADAPEQARLGGCRAGVDVVAIEAKAGLESQRIARAEADRLDLGRGQKLAGDRLGRLGRSRDLIAVATGIARAGDVAARAIDHDKGAGHEFHRSHSRRKPRQYRGGERSLQGNE